MNTKRGINFWVYPPLTQKLALIEDAGANPTTIFTKSLEVVIGLAEKDVQEGEHAFIKVVRVALQSSSRENSLSKHGKFEKFFDDLFRQVPEDFEPNSETGKKLAKAIKQKIAELEKK